MTHTADDGTVRQDHYGAGRQPWDNIVGLGWAPHFAAGNVLKYLRRTKEPEHSLASARWYWARLREMSTTRTSAGWAMKQLREELTADELDRLTE
jgi:hypothetical protein